MRHPWGRKTWIVMPLVRQKFGRDWGKSAPLSTATSFSCQDASSSARREGGGDRAPQTGGSDQRKRANPQRQDGALAGLFRDPGELAPPFVPTGRERPPAQAQSPREDQPAIAERLGPAHGVAQGFQTSTRVFAGS